MTEPHHVGQGTEGSIASEVSVEVASIVAAAENAAAAIRQRAEVEAQARVREADARARSVLAEATAEADRLVVDRLRRISELSDSVVERAATVVDQLDHADEVRRQLNGLLMGLAKTAERVARELGTEQRPEPEPPRGEPGLPADAPAPRPPSLAVEASIPPPAALAAEASAPPAAQVVELHRTPAVEPPPEQEPMRHDEPLSADDAAAGDAARLVALQMAVAGSTRGEVAEHLQRAFAIEQPHPILDEVFGEGDGGR